MRNKENKGWVDGMQGRMRQKGSLLQRFLAGVLSLILLLFSPLQASAATATVNGLTNMGNVYKTVGSTTYLSNADRTYSPLIMWYLNGTSKISYCIDFGHECYSGDTFTSSGTMASFTAEQQLWLKATMYHGFQSAYSCSHGSYVNDCITCRTQYAATQALVWLITDGSFTDAGTAYAFGQYVASTVLSGSYYNAIWSYYETLYNNVAATVKIPSFTANNSSSAPTLTMKWDNYNQRYYLYQPDSKSVIGDFTLSGVPSAMTVNKGADYLELKSSSAVSRTLVTLTANRTVQTVVWWIANNTNNANQPHLQYGATTENVTVTSYAYLQSEAAGSVGILKRDGISTKVVSGAVYGIYEDSGCGREITSVTTGTGYVYVTLAPGTYYVKEKTAPPGYAKSSVVYTASVSSGGTTKLTVTDEPWSGVVKVVKTSGTNSSTYVAGAMYGLYSDVGCMDLLDADTTGSNGALTFSYPIRYGTAYYVQELSAPAGYKLDTTVYTIEATALTGNGATVTVNVKDMPTYNITTEVVNGTISNPVYNVDAGGNVTVSYQEKDGYRLESIVVDGVAVSANGHSSGYTFSNISANHHIKVVYASTKYLIRKVDEKGNALAGASLQLYDVTAGSVVAEWTTDSIGSKPFEAVLIAGHTYRIREVKAPSGYYMAEDISFTVPYENMELQTITMVNRSGYRCSVTLTKRIVVDEIIFAQGNPTFIFRLAGADDEGQFHTFYDVVTFTKEYVETHSKNGYVEASITFHVKPGVYTASEEKSIRYDFDSITAVTGGSIFGENVTFDLETYDTASAVFINRKTEYRNYSHCDVIVNHVGRP